jgi:hypothetical protein
MGCDIQMTYPNRCDTVFHSVLEAFWKRGTNAGRIRESINLGEAGFEAQLRELQDLGC